MAVLVMGVMVTDTYNNQLIAAVEEMAEAAMAMAAAMSTVTVTGSQQ